MDCYIFLHSLLGKLIIVFTLIQSGIHAQMPEFNNRNVNISVIKGNNAVLPCSVENLGNYKVVWTNAYSTLLTFNDRRIIDDARISITRPYQTDWYLNIRNVRESDSGWYTCQMNTSPVKSKQFILTVLVPPRIISFSSDVESSEGDTVTLFCNVSGYPPPIVSWYRLSQGYTLATREEDIGSSGEKLVIDNIQRSDSGIYRCRASNGIDPPVSTDISVNVSFPPEVNVLLKRIVQYVGKDTVLECSIKAYPQGMSYWMYRGKELQHSQKYSVELYDNGRNEVVLSLMIRNLQPADFGEYVCHGVSMLGEDYNSTLLVQHGAGVNSNNSSSTLVLTQMFTTRKRTTQMTTHLSTITDTMRTSVNGSPMTTSTAGLHTLQKMTTTRSQRKSGLYEDRTSQDVVYTAVNRIISTKPSNRAQKMHMSAWMGTTILMLLVSAHCS